MNNHTQGKLYVVEVGSNGVAPSGCEIVIDDAEFGNPDRDYFLFSAVHGDPDELAANANRLVACWNACDGIPNDRLKLLNVPNIIELVSQRDSLLSGVQMLLDVLDELSAECDEVGEFQAPIRMARASLTEALGTPATDPEAASAFDEMMGYAAFPSIKGEQK